MGLLRFILGLIHSAVLFLLLGTLLNEYISPSAFPWLNFLSLAFPILMTVHILLCLFWIFNWKKRVFLFLLLSLFLFNGVSRWVNYHSEKTDKPDIKILTYNVHGARGGKEAIEEYIKSTESDVVFLQESGPGKNYNLGLKNVADRQKVIAMFTNHRVLQTKRLIEDGSNSYALMADVEINRRVYRFVNVYLEPFQLDKSMVKPSKDVKYNEDKAKKLARRMIPVFQAHQHQVKAILEGIQNSPYPVIIAGDFNAVPNSYEYYQVAGRYQDAFLAAGSGSATSFHDYKFPLRIDYAFSSDHLVALSYQVNRNIKLSDHFPVTATFKIKLHD